MEEEILIRNIGNLSFVIRDDEGEEVDKKL